MENSSPKPTRGFRGFLNKATDKFLGRLPALGYFQQLQPSQALRVRPTVLHYATNGENTPTPRNNELGLVDTVSQSLAEVWSGSPVVNPISPRPPDVVEEPAKTEPPPVVKSPPVIESFAAVGRLLVAGPPAVEIPLTIEPPQVVGPSVANTNSTTKDVQSTPEIPVSSQSIKPLPLESRKAITGVWRGLETALCGLRATTSLFPLVQSAVVALLPCLDIIQATDRVENVSHQEVSKHRQEYEELAADLASLTEALAQHLDHSASPSMSNSIAKIARDIEEQCKLINSKRGRGISSHILEASADVDEIAKCYRQIGSLFRQLQTNVNLSMWSIVNEQMIDTRLAKLSPAKLANYDSQLSISINRRTCTEGTRTAILSCLNDWSYDPKAADIYWMNGMAGTGKTTIACTFAKSLDERNQLAASFFCTCTIPECLDVNRIIPTIAYQLAQHSVPYKSTLCELLGNDPDISTKTIEKQFERLLKDPLLKVKEAIPSSLVVVIDALDECDKKREVELLLSTLLESAADLPLRFFVTSRPEPEIYNRMVDRGQGQHTVTHLHEVEKSLVQADIELYLEAELGVASPTPAQVKELARRSGTLFIYAATLVRYICSRRAQANPQQRLKDILALTSDSNRHYAAINSLYAAVLKAALDDEGLTPNEAENVHQVLRTVICVQEPVSLKVLTMLAGVMNEAETLSALQPLRAVVHLSETSGLVSTLHASFPDFMLDETRSGLLCCKLGMQSEVVAQHCFEIMKSQLRFNICGLESSFVIDSDVPDMDKRVEEGISPALWYACRYWGHHLKCARHASTLSVQLAEFLSSRLLFWMEVLNLKHDISTGIDTLLKSTEWLMISDHDELEDIVTLAEDARNFVTSFAANPVSRSTPHIYISALPFCAKSSSVFKGYWTKARGLMSVMGSGMQAREAGALAEWKTSSAAFTISYSPDNNCIATGHRDGTITIRNAHNGALVVGPLEGHTDWVNSVTYSPDGTHIVSGSWDRTLRVWHAHNGTLVAGPLEGHTDCVRSIAYSPDGTHIVSGSGDMTIRVWNEHDGTLVTSPLKGHTDSVNSVAYSPDGTRIASGSNDKTIRVWNAQGGTLVAGPLEGHTSSVNSVAYSPDGTRIVSGSYDKTILVWNALDGMLVANPLRGHTDSVDSVGYSPGGTHIVSGSSDKTIRVWNALNGMLVSGPLKGHTSPVNSVAYSPDGTRIISTSFDMTIRVWHAHNGTLVAGPLKGHTGSVHSVAYSPDGTRIVSSSGDKTIRVWNAHDGTFVVGPLEGHTDSVSSVAYSPDSTRIVSGSWDKTLRVWNACNGTLILGPLEGHTGWVTSAAYTPDGTRIVSGSGDMTIRVWDAHNGTLVASPLEGHNGSVDSVTYSPNGAYIASGSYDGTIRVWSAQGGTLVAGPLEGHTSSVNSVAYSPDGTRIVSGSSDKTIRVWDARNGTLVVGPLKGHTSSVNSVAYSPDGTRIVSGSFDKTIRVWHARNGTLIAGPLVGHIGSANSVAYSPDGTRIVSGSWDKVIRVWHAHDDALPTGLPVSLLKSSNPIAEDGWIMTAEQNLLFWVPPELRFAFTPSRLDCVLLIDGAKGSLGIDYGDMLFGPRWAQCYLSE